jgi:hypothetical protein
VEILKLVVKDNTTYGGCNIEKIWSTDGKLNIRFSNKDKHFGTVVIDPSEDNSIHVDSGIIAIQPLKSDSNLVSLVNIDGDLRLMLMSARYGSTGSVSCPW